MGLISMYSYFKIKEFCNTENVNVYFQRSSPAEEKSKLQVVSKWLNGTVESSRILVLFLEAADKILILKHFFFSCLSLKSPCITKQRSWCSANCSILYVLVLYRPEHAKRFTESYANI